MALGWDIAVAEAADEAGLPFCAAIPFAAQARRWSEQDQVRYYRACERASRFVMIGQLELTVSYLKRDRWIVDHCKELHALDSGRKSGSHTTVLYAEEVGRKVVPLWDEWIQFRARR